MVLGFFVTLFKFFDFGPGNNNMQDVVELCRREWWKNLLYVNNFRGLLPEGDKC